MRTYFGVLLLVAAAEAVAWCGNDVRLAALAKTWQNAEPIRGLPSDLSMADAVCIRDALIRALEPRLGRVTGYKVALTHPAIQKQVGHFSPVRGVLLERMLVNERAAPISARYGARPVVEADLLVEVGDESINQARTPLEALKALSRVAPFVELADLVVAEGEPLTGSIITAINAGARAGVIGKAIAVEPTASFAEALASMRVVLSDGSGKVLATSQGAAIMGHPLNSLLWLVQDLSRNGVRLRRGDRISLGAFSPPVPARPGLRITAAYYGLPGEPRVTVQFE
jgi:2-keto-4-pentenoate hydratase